MRGLIVLIGVSAALAFAAGSAGTRPARVSCAPPPVSSAYAASVRRALSAKQDVWGNKLLARRNGPTYDAARRFLKPLLFARSRRRPLTKSGVYYLPFAQPLGDRGAGVVALHVGDGSQILSQKASGRSLTVYVGGDGHERYGSCLRRAKRARLAAGYLPILQTRYTDAAGVRYRQESFAVRGLGTGALVTFLHITADARQASRLTRVRLALSSRRVAGGEGLLGAGPTLLAYSPGGHRAGSSVVYRVSPGQVEHIYAGWQIQRGTRRPLPMNEDRYEAARARVAGFWPSRLSRGAEFLVPEQRVLDAEQSLLIQNLALTWRYSVGNSYQEFSFAEALNTAQVMAAYGFTDISRQILHAALPRLKTRRSNWRMGEKLIGTAFYFRLTRDRTYLVEARPELRRILAIIRMEVRAKGRGGLLRKEQFSTDVPNEVYGLHAQAAVWQGLRAMSFAWRQTGDRTLAAKARALSVRLGRALRAAVRKSARWLPDGSLFVPAALLADHKPFDPVIASRLGSYWNLVIPYALASGLFPPHSRESAGLLRYMLNHGSRLLGLVRAGAYSLYGNPKYPVSGIDQVYGLNMARFLADNDLPDQLTLSLYGMLAVAMTPDTYVSGEAASIAPIKGAAYRSMSRPPNSASNAAFLETLRLLLVHETRDSRGKPSGLQLAFSTPRPWLDPGKTIEVREAPTSFGPVSYSISAEQGRVEASVDVPSRRSPRALHLRFRLPRGQEIGAVRVDGSTVPFDRAAGTINLTGKRGSVDVVASIRRAR